MYKQLELFDEIDLQCLYLANLTRLYEKLYSIQDVEL